MAQEYVVVEDPHAPKEPRTKRLRGSRRRRTVVAVAFALILGAMVAALVWPDGDSDREAQPTPEPEPPTVNAARATTLVYQEWEDRKQLVACLTDRGFPYEPRIVDNADSLPLVAQYLELEPATADPDAPVPMLRQPDLYLGRGGAAMAERTRGGSACTMPHTPIDADDDEVVAQAVDAARADGAFLTTVAEQVWVQQHPAEVTHAISLLRHDRAAGMGGADSTQWDAALDIVVEVARERAVWVPVVAESQEGFGQVVGLTETGGAVAVRVGSDDGALDRGTYLTRSNVLPCGPVTISAGVKEPWGTSAELDVLVEALGPACNALMGAGLVEGESLAEVYWD